MADFQIWQKTEKTTYNNNDVFAINDSEETNKFKKMKLSTIMSGKPMSDEDKTAAGYLITDEVYYDGYPNLQKGGLHAKGVKNIDWVDQEWEQYEDGKMIVKFRNTFTFSAQSYIVYTVSHCKNFTEVKEIKGSPAILAGTAIQVIVAGVYNSTVSSEFVLSSITNGPITGVTLDVFFEINGSWKQ